MRITDQGYSEHCFMEEIKRSSLPSFIRFKNLDLSWAWSEPDWVCIPPQPEDLARERQG